MDRHQFPKGTDKIDEKRAEYWVKVEVFGMHRMQSSSALKEDWDRRQSSMEV